MAFDKTARDAAAALSAQVDGLTADQIADGETKVSMTVGDRAAVRAAELALADGYDSLGETAPTTNFGAANNFKRWAVAIDIGVDVNIGDASIAAIPLNLQIGTGGAKVRLRLWKRATSGSLTAPPGATGDILLTQQDYALDSLGLIAGGPAANVRLVLEDHIAAASITGSTLLIDVEGLDVSNAQVLFGAGARNNPGGLSQRARGFYFTSGWNGIADNNATVLAWKLEALSLFSALSNDMWVGAAEGRLTDLEVGKAAADENIAAVNDALVTSYINRGEIVRTDDWGVGPYNRWFFGGDVGVEIAPGAALNYLFTALRTYSTATTKVRLTVLLRDLASSALNTAGQQPGDVAYGPYTFDLAAVSAGVLPAANVTAQCRLAIGAGIPASALAGNRVYFFIEGLARLIHEPAALGRAGFDVSVAA